MYRNRINNLIQWKDSVRRKPLILRGARQVGKTWLMKRFGCEYFESVAYINFDHNSAMANLFSEDFSIPRLIQGLQIESGMKIVPEKTLILFDEIQECPAALTSLKYFCEQAPQYPIIAAGSLLGVSLHSGVSFPVGKVDFLNLQPMSFEEFLMAVNESELCEAVTQLNFPLMKTFSSKLTNLLRQYMFIGGMPEAVESFVESNDLNEVRRIQRDILTAYEQDFSKHIPSSVTARVRGLWQSIPSQLGKENRKYIFGALKKGARASEYETALNWLSDCGLVYKVCNVSKPDVPLKSYEIPNTSKLFMSDVGLLGAMAELDSKTLLEGSRIFEEFKGALTEQYVLQELKTVENLPIYYWSSSSGSAKLDFLLQSEASVIPVEVKATINLQAKSLKTFREKFTPSRSIRFSLADYKQTDDLLDVPLYAVGQVKELLTKVMNSEL